jgi:hypothetical protein
MVTQSVRLLRMVLTTTIFLGAAQKPLPSVQRPTHSSAQRPVPGVSVVPRVPPTEKAPAEGEFLYDSSQGATPAYENTRKWPGSWHQTEVRFISGLNVGVAVSARKVPVALGLVEILVRRDALGSNKTYRELADWLKKWREDVKLMALKYIQYLFERQEGDSNFHLKTVNAWADGFQSGYGNLTASISLDVYEESIDPAIISFKPHGKLSPGLYGLLPWPLWLDQKRGYFLVGPVELAQQLNCFNIWRGDPDFGRPLLKPCKEGLGLTAAERRQLDIGTEIRRKLDRMLPGWQVSRNRVSEHCGWGSPWPPYFAWGDFDGDGREDYAVQAYLGRSLRLILFFNRPTGLEPLVADVAEPLAPDWKELPGDHPALEVLPAGAGYYDHERNVGGRLPYETVVQAWCESSAVAYIYRRGAVRKVWIRD